MCSSDHKPDRSKPRGGRSQKEIDHLKRRGAWFRWVFIDLDHHAPGCRWVQFLSILRFWLCPWQIAGHPGERP